jgi:hypothetical protein
MKASRIGFSAPVLLALSKQSDTTHIKIEIRLIELQFDLEFSDFHKYLEGPKNFVLLSSKKNKSFLSNRSISDVLQL